MKIENKLAFHQEEGRWEHWVSAHTAPEGWWWARSLVGSGGCFPGEEPFMVTRLLWERDPGRRVCAFHEERWRKGSVLVSQNRAAHAHSMGEGLKDTEMCL